MTISRVYIQIHAHTVIGSQYHIVSLHNPLYLNKSKREGVKLDAAVFSLIYGIK